MVQDVMNTCQRRGAHAEPWGGMGGMQHAAAVTDL